MSADLTWQVIRNNHCFIRTQRGIPKKFSTEKFNLKGVNSKRYNGLVNKRAIDVSAAADGKGVVISTKNTNSGSARRPAKSVTTVTIKNRTVALRSVKRIAKAYKKPEQFKLAQRRAAAIIRSQTPRSKKFVKKTEA